MSEKQKKDQVKPDRKTIRVQRLRESLRANLQRRKAQARARKTDPADNKD